MDNREVPSPINFHRMQDARGWESTAMDRPFRLDMFEKFVEVFLERNFESVLELGSGPGFLAKFLCDRIPGITLTLLDFSEAMHELARDRLKDCEQNIEFVRRDFKESDWTQGLGKFDCVFSNQAVHELRHKSYSEVLHKQVRGLLANGGVYLVCDHFCGPEAMENSELYMTPDEQLSCLRSAEFSTKVLLRKGSMQLIQTS